MNITLTPELETFINEQIQAGLYASPGELVRDSLHLFKRYAEQRRLQFEELRREIMIGVEAGEQGRFTIYNSAEELIADVKKAGIAELERRKAEQNK